MVVYIPMTLKSQNHWYITTFYGVNILVLCAFLNQWDISSFADSISSIPADWRENIFFVSLISVSSIIVNSVFSSKMKAQIVYFRWKDPLPGCRAFSHYMNVDPRIDKQVLKNRLGDLPADPKTQNAVWYRLLKKQEKSNPVICQSHRLWLLTRDATTISAVFLVGFLMASALKYRDEGINAWFLAIFLFQFIIVVSAARNAGNGLVRNVLATESSLTE